MHAVAVEDSRLLHSIPAARVALMARHILGVAITSNASDTQIEQATIAMGNAFNSLLIAVRAFDAAAPIIENHNDAPQAAAHRLLPSLSPLGTTLGRAQPLCMSPRERRAQTNDPAGPRSPEGQRECNQMPYGCTAGRSGSALGRAFGVLVAPIYSHEDNQRWTRN